MTRRLSASRLNDFLACQHRAALWLADVQPPEEIDESLELVRRKGFEHEAAVLASLERDLGAAVSISDKAPLQERLSATAAALSKGAPLIYQAAFANERWVGFPDILVRTGRTGDGLWLYEPQDAKLARHAKAEHLIQLNIYAELLKERSGTPIAGGVIHLGGGGEPERFNLRQTQHITGRLMRQFETFADLPERPTRAVKTAACGQCSFKSRCEDEWRREDSPVFIAGITSAQISKLESQGVTTLTAVANLDPGAPVGGIATGVFAKIVRQAQLQKKGAVEGKHSVELLPVEPQRGFALLPTPQAGDLFFDMEGNPHYPGGLEYLFGLWGPLGEDGADAFLPIWAHHPAAEKAAFEDLMRLFARHFVRYPNAHIYHYAAYEPLALKKLASRNATMEADLDHLLRDQRFVDLYTVARQAIRASTEGYSLKDLEKIYWGKREGEVTSAGDSIVQYERWMEIGDQSILDAIERYNEDDCVSTARMRDWLEELRPPEGRYGLKGLGDVIESEPDDRAALREAFEARRLELAKGIRASGVSDDRVRNLLAELLWFHQRAQKPVWWQIFDRQTWTDDELTEDVESLGGLHLARQEQDKRSYVATYRFEPQDTRLKVGSTPKIADTLEPAGAITLLSAEDGVVALRRGMAKGDFPRSCSLSPGSPIDQKVLVNGGIALIERLIANPASDQAFLNLLERRPPCLKGRVQGAAIGDGLDPLADTLAAVQDLDRSTLIIQGPPGTGKTYTTARAIVALLKDGKRVGVSSNSHKAINNVLAAIEEHAADIGFRFLGAKKASSADSDSRFDGRCISSVERSEDVGGAFRLVGGTAFHFASEAIGSFDYLFVDEAGQVAIGNLAAMAGCAQNLVLVGDQMQLPQPVQGVHPAESGLSCLDYAMQDHPTVPPDRGILLNVTRRMHPTICDVISQAIYDGRLTAHSSTAQRRLVLSADPLPGIKPSGLSVIEIGHQGCTQSSSEEAESISRLIGNLLRQELADGNDARPLTLDDIVVVSPFNMQVNLLKRRLPEGARVGTVDKFQGQEAPIVIVSMATSYGGDAPRGTEFLFNRNRLNVAISRAKCLAILVRGARLLEVASASKDDLPRLDLLAYLDAAQSLTTDGTHNSTATGSA